MTDYDKNKIIYVRVLKSFPTDISKILETGKMAIKLAFLEKETTQSPQSTEIYEPALRWTLEL